MRIADLDLSRGWEATEILVIDFNRRGPENLVMRTEGGVLCYC